MLFFGDAVEGVASLFFYVDFNCFACVLASGVEDDFEVFSTASGVLVESSFSGG